MDKRSSAQSITHEQVQKPASLDAVSDGLDADRNFPGLLG